MASVSVPAPAPAQAVDPSVSFAQSLKSYGEKEFKTNPKKPATKTTCRMVVAFDSAQFHKMCHPASPSFEPSLNFDVIASELFKVGETWSSRDGILYTALDELGKLHGFFPRKQKDHICCNRHGQSRTQRNFMGGDLYADCTFKVKLKALCKNSYKATPESKKFSYTELWTEPVRIVDACCRHGGTCTPNRQNRIMAGQRSGKYVNKMPDHALFTLCNHVEKKGKLTTSFIKSTIEPVWPSAKGITKSDCFNIKVKVFRLLPIFTSTRGDYEEFKAVANANHMLQGIDNAPTLDDDEAYTMAQSLWLEVEDTAKSRDEAIFSFIEYLDLIKARAKGFSYELAHVATNNKRKLRGLLWQTATMRRNVELYGDYMCFDMMKRAITTLLWPYAALAMYDDAKKLVIGCEGILCGETFDMYLFLCSFLQKYTPARPLSSVKIVSGDGFFDQEMVNSLGFTNARFITDQHHLIDSGLEKRFGKAGKDLLIGHLLRMIRATSMEDFEDTLRAAQILLQSQPIRNGQTEARLLEFAALRAQYAQYCIDQIPGNRGLHGNNISEANNFSVLCFLNDGDRKGNKFCEHPIVLIRELLKRQRKQVNSTNQRLFGESSKLDTEKFNLSVAPGTPANLDLRCAANVLNLTAYEQYKKNQHRAVNDLYIKEFMDPVTSMLCHQVGSTRYPDAPPHIFTPTTQRCNCINRVAEEGMCAHEIKWKQGFHEPFFLPWHRFRAGVSGSLVGWVPSDSTIDDIIGYQEESFVLAEGDTRNMISNGDLGKENEALLPPGHLADLGRASVQPLTLKSVENILENVCAGYTRSSSTKKFAISQLAIQLQQLMTTDETQCQEATSSAHGLSIMVPNQDCLKKQPHNRLVPRHERDAAKAKKTKFSVDHAAGNMVIHGKENDIVVNTQLGQKYHCRFCDGDHQYPSCGKRRTLRESAYEYMLTTEHPMNASILRTRIKHSMPHSPGPRGMSVLDSLCSDQYQRNFIIHEASIVNGVPHGELENMTFCVTFLNKKANKMDTRIWISGKAMNEVLAHTKKKTKFIYDETIQHKQGWTVPGMVPGVAPDGPTEMEA